MLETSDAVPMLAVKDPQRAQQFYEDVLGLHVTSAAHADVLTCHSGKTHFMLYKSDFAGTNKATTLLWAVGDQLEEIVQKLKKKGVTFEHYDFPESALEGDVQIAGALKMAWFKDPDGNILHLMNT